MESEYPLPCSQEPATGPCPELVASSSQPIYLRSVKIFSFHIDLCIVFQSGRSTSGFPTKIVYESLNF
jgi:hypothetical protein